MIVIKVIVKRRIKKYIITIMIKVKFALRFRYRPKMSTLISKHSEIVCYHYILKLPLMKVIKKLIKYIIMNINKVKFLIM